MPFSLGGESPGRVTQVVGVFSIDMLKCIQKCARGMEKTRGSGVWVGDKDLKVLQGCSRGRSVGGGRNTGTYLRDSVKIYQV